jgi:hypothetical protein
MARDGRTAQPHDRAKEAAMSARDTGRTDPAERALRIERGEVVCPRWGIVDIEVCWVCRDYGGLAEGWHESLICGASEDLVASAFWPLERGPSNQRA